METFFSATKIAQPGLELITCELKIKAQCPFNRGRLSTRIAAGIAVVYKTRTVHRTWCPFDRTCERLPMTALLVAGNLYTWHKGWKHFFDIKTMTRISGLKPRIINPQKITTAGHCFILGEWCWALRHSGTRFLGTHAYLIICVCKNYSYIYR